MRETILVLSLAMAATALAQTPAPTRRTKVLTPEQTAYQQALKTYAEQRDKLRNAAISAYNAEADREKSPACPDVSTTYDVNMCLSHENDVTTANYKTFSANIRAMLALPSPRFPGEPETYDGPSGREATPATNTAAFDAAESAWHSYASAQCSAVDTLWRGGTIVNSMVLECELRLARSRMHELNHAYDMQLHH